MSEYYVGNIEERVGELEFTTTVRFTTSGSPDCYLERIAGNWRLENAEWSDEYGAYDHGDGIAVINGSWQEVSQDVFETLAGIVTAL